MDYDIQRIAFSHSVGKAGLVDVVRLSALRQREMDHSIYEPTKLDFHLMQFIVSGKGKHWSDFQPVGLQQGDVLIVRAGQVHAFDPDSDHESILLTFMPKALQQGHIPAPVRWAANTVLHPCAEDFGLMVDLLKVQELLDTRAQQLHSENVGPYLLGAILSCVSQVVGAQQSAFDGVEQKYQQIIHAFEELLDEHHTSTRSVSWYSSQLHVTPRTLTRACGRIRHQSPKQLIDSRVVLGAKRLLVTTASTVEAIGLELGFTEATNFVKFFKRAASCTPEEFRKGGGLA